MIFLKRSNLIGCPPWINSIVQILLHDVSLYRPQVGEFQLSNARQYWTTLTSASILQLLLCLPLKAGLSWDGLKIRELLLLLPLPLPMLLLLLHVQRHRSCPNNRKKLRIELFQKTSVLFFNRILLNNKSHSTKSALWLKSDYDQWKKYPLRDQIIWLIFSSERNFHNYKPHYVIKRSGWLNDVVFFFATFWLCLLSLCAKIFHVVE